LTPFTDLLKIHENYLAMFGIFKKKLTLNSYIYKLTPALVKGFGALKFYTPGQVNRILEKTGLNSTYKQFAIAMFCGKEEFENFYQGDEAPGYEKLRMELAKRYFNENDQFQMDDILRKASQSLLTGSFSESGIGEQHGSA
jgi:hypothetical protein